MIISALPQGGGQAQGAVEVICASKPRDIQVERCEARQHPKGLAQPFLLYYRNHECETLELLWAIIH